MLLRSKNRHEGSRKRGSLLEPVVLVRGWEWKREKGPEGERE